MPIINRLYSLLILSLFFAGSCKKHDTTPPKPPVAEAGNPQTIQLPVNNATLTGSGASTNGSISSYQWTLVSGPSVPVLGQAGSSSTSVTGMIQGVYHFQFKVTDATGLTGTDTTSITVLAALIPPVANAGDSQTVQLPTSTATLTGSGTTTNGNITGYQWTLISGPNVPGISQPTASSTDITGLVGGTYYFQLKVTDAANLTGLDTTAVTVLYDVQTGLVAYYNFNGGNLNDSSGYGNNITFNNATPATDRLGRTNNAYSFDGVNSYMVVPNNGILSPTNITIMAIVKFNGFNMGICHSSEILMKGSQDQDQGVYALRVLQGDGSCAAQLDTSTQHFVGFYGNYGSTTSSYAQNYTIRTNTWVNVVYTFDGSTSKTYINGELSNTNAQAAQFNPNNFDIYIGKTQNPTYPYTFNGSIDEIRIYNRALSAQAIKQLSNLTN